MTPALPRPPTAPETAKTGWKLPSQFSDAAGVTQTLATAVLALAVWQLVVMAFSLPPYILPAPSAILSEGFANLGRIGPHFFVTLQEATTGYILAVLISVPLAALIAYSAVMRRTAYPATVFLDIVPKVAFAPLFITWFGFGPEPAVILTTITCLFPILIEGIHGFQSVEPEMLHLARSAGGREWETFWKIRLPHALPYLFVGLKYAGAVAMTGAVVAEFLAGFQGLGFFLLAALKRLQMPLGFATIAAMTVIGLSLFFGMHVVERLVIPWHVSQRAAIGEGRRPK